MTSAFWGDEGIRGLKREKNGSVGKKRFGKKGHSRTHAHECRMTMLVSSRVSEGFVGDGREKWGSLSLIESGIESVCGL